jgi:hypothetical protein
MAKDLAGIGFTILLTVRVSFSTLRNNILVVSVGCNEPPGTFNPPAGKWDFMHLRCNPVTNHVDGREAGVMLRFFYDYYGMFDPSTKIIFIHAHDRSKHIKRTTIWRHLNRLVTTNYFKERSFGEAALKGHRVWLFFRPFGSEIHAALPHFSKSVNITDWTDFLFSGTSFTPPGTMRLLCPCCSTFFMNAGLITEHPREEYRLLLDRTRKIVREGHCGMFDRAFCRSGVKVLNDKHESWNYVASEVFERVWALMFTGTAREWMPDVPGQGGIGR